VDDSCLITEFAVELKWGKRRQRVGIEIYTPRIIKYQVSVPTPFGPATSI
jgi:hypothetical protein